MKKLACIALVGMSFISLSSFADYPPKPPAGVSCKTQYLDNGDTADFCGCYQQAAIAQCDLLAQKHLGPTQHMCDAGIESLNSTTCWDEGRRGINTFCKQNIAKLRKAGDTTTKIGNCIDDVGYICDGGGNTKCKPYWR